LIHDAAVDVLKLGAWCDLHSEAEYREELIARGMPDQQIRQDIKAFKRSAAFRVSEFALLSDGRRVTLHNERGFNSWSSSGDPWSHLTLEGVAADVLTTVLPDDGDPQEEHPWEWLAELLTAHGVEVSSDELRSLPYVIEYSDRLLARLALRGNRSDPLTGAQGSGAR
jgi:hypothetical protein